MVISEVRESGSAFHRRSSVCPWNRTAVPPSCLLVACNFAHESSDVTNAVDARVLARVARDAGKHTYKLTLTFYVTTYPPIHTGFELHEKKKSVRRETGNSRSVHTCATERNGQMNKLLQKPEPLSSLVQGHACPGKKHDAGTDTSKRGKSRRVAVPGSGSRTQQPERQVQQINLSL